MSAKVSLKL